MIQIFAVALCFTFPGHPAWDKCDFLGRDFVFQTAEQCTQYVQKYPKGVEPDRILQYACFTKTVDTWQAVK